MEIRLRLFLAFSGEPYRRTLSLFSPFPGFLLQGKRVPFFNCSASVVREISCVGPSPGMEKLGQCVNLQIFCLESRDTVSPEMNVVPLKYGIVFKTLLELTEQRIEIEMKKARH
ncbi:hypothetical protein CEXT_127901 [Caerostris extrusa]|uniref:Uncharacterized protein n=1 Tax=Caerostris extrusa TaxID=172846 RepID=A0AAV4SUJ9_CAEEX|nr:hypothetical protein CEXT_127901 [Caerostris extrusa]